MAGHREHTAIHLVNQRPWAEGHGLLGPGKGKAQLPGRSPLHRSVRSMTRVMGVSDTWGPSVQPELSARAFMSSIDLGMTAAACDWLMRPELSLRVVEPTQCVPGGQRFARAV